uniref:NADH dehydrogenase subunit 6 n=4 Tax=Scoloplos TaxID=46604 RepID=Q19NV1_9ANNE|nr:NADH dehydrogenase subunit 6 [Scoloplos cf. armiger CB-2006]
MTIMTIISFTILLSLMILSAHTPLSLGCGILLLSMLGTFTIATLKSSWLAMFIFLVYIGGLLILFMYFTATIPNQSMQYQTWWKLTSIIMTLPFCAMWTPLIQSSYTNTIFSLMDSMNTSFYLFLMLTLLLTLIASVKLTQFNRGPLRNFNA